MGKLLTMLRNIMFQGVMGILLAVGVTSCSVVPMTGRNRVMLVPDDAILQSSFQQYQEFISKAPKSRNAAGVAQVRRIGERIARATEAYLNSIGMADDAKKYRWEFNLIASDQANAFCMPGGKIVVYEGLMRFARTDDELATVMSHEVAHAVAKHANERMSQSLLRQYGAGILDLSLGGKSVAVRQAANAVYGIGSQMLVMLPYSRSHEYEADQIGLYLMALAGYNPSSALSFWQKMNAGTKETVPELMSTHPSHGNRIQRIKDELPKVAAFMGKGNAKPNVKNAPKPKLQKKRNVEYIDNSKRKVPLKTHY